MCAISGLFRFQGHQITPSDEAAVRQMSNVQSHRGPDDEGLFKHSRCCLGHRRLSILDLSNAGHQPWASSDGQIQLVYNGEIYNFRELRKELKAAGHSFRSETDTEVLVSGYLAWGLEGLLGRLRGMFAFALFDETTAGRPRLILARDRFGIKPLYYALSPEGILFASEVRALQASRLIKQEMDPRGLMQLLLMGSVSAPFTTQKEIRSLPAGHAMVLENHPAEPHSYWSFPDVLRQERLPIPADHAVHQAKALLEKTVEQHLMSDVPLGIFLSGGIDSSALVGLARKAMSGPLTTLSVTFEEDLYNEAAYAGVAARHYRTDHREILLKQSDFTLALDTLFAAMDQPTVDGINTWFVSKAAHDAGLKVVLSGLGADELFSGYRHLQNASLIQAGVRAAGMVPGWMRKGIGSILGRISPRLGRKMWCLEDPTLMTPYWLARGLFSPSAIAGLTGLERKEIVAFAASDIPESDFEDLDSEARMRLLEYRYYLQNQLLKDSDVMSMAHSLELRVPFLDHELVSGILSLPPVAGKYPGIPKALLVKALGPDFPKEIWDRPKQGFTFPFDPWMRKASGELEAMALEHTPLNSTAVRGVWSDFRAGRLHWSRAWMTVVAARFYGH